MKPIILSPRRLEASPLRYGAFISRDGWIGLAAVLGAIAGMLWGLVR